MLRLLIVDDEVDICDFVKSFFKDRNFEVFTANNGKQAVDMVKSEKPEIVLMDIRMPVMDGMEALKEIRKLDGAIKVIMITAIEDEKKAEEAKHHGAIEYITKPLLLEQLERTVFTIAEQIKMNS
ncbi:MAG: response regulator [Candidatus Omnitrophota bacterium]|nr:response regulator [Candidatus Omnitrophota bacterium]